MEGVARVAAVAAHAQAARLAAPRGAQLGEGRGEVALAVALEHQGTAQHVGAGVQVRELGALMDF